MWVYIQNFINARKFNHLEAVGQTYTSHFSDSMSYSFESLKSAFYFFIHAIYPDVFIKAGSSTILNLSENIEYKLNRHFDV